MEGTCYAAKQVAMAKGRPFLSISTGSPSVVCNVWSEAARDAAEQERQARENVQSAREKSLKQKPGYKEARKEADSASARAASNPDGNSYDDAHDAEMRAAKQAPDAATADAHKRKALQHKKKSQNLRQKPIGGNASTSDRIHDRIKDGQQGTAYDTEVYK